MSEGGTKASTEHTFLYEMQVRRGKLRLLIYFSDYGSRKNHQAIKYCLCWDLVMKKRKSFILWYRNLILQRTRSSSTLTALTDVVDFDPEWDLVARYLTEGSIIVAIKFVFHMNHKIGNSVGLLLFELLLLWNGLKVIKLCTELKSK